MPTNDVVAALEAASKGLLYQSETDEPFSTFVWGKADEELTGSKVLKRIKKPVKTPVQEMPLADFFKDLTQEQDWHEEEEKAAVKRYRSLLKAVQQNLTGAKVFKIGKTKLNVYVVGKTDEGDWVGLKTAAVET